MEKHIERIKKEKEELDNKIHKLEYFIDTNDKFNELSELQQTLMKTQLQSMIIYTICLKERLKEALNLIN